MFSSEAWLSNSSNFYNSVATQSLRLDSGSSSYLYDTASGTESSTTNRAISFWYKRTKVDVGAGHTILTGFVSGPVVKEFIQFRADNTLRVLVQQSSASNQTRWTTDQVFRDTSAWYHIFIKYALGESSNADKVKIYVNGSLVDTDGGVATGANVTSSQLLTAGTDIRIGSYYNTSSVVDGYLAEFNLIDGTANHTDFGELKNGVWIPIEYTGSYGNSGFRLEFNQTGTGTASTTTIGADTGGNLKHFSSSGIDTEDCNMPDSPENGFATICPLSSVAGTFSEGNLKYVSTADTGNTNFGFFSGKFYAEVYVNATSNSFIGICDIGNGLNPNRGGNFISHGAIAYKQDGNQYSLPVGGSSTTASYGASYTTGDIIGIAVDIDSDTVTFYKNGVSQGNTTNGVSHISANGVYGVLLYGSSSTFTVNFGQDPSFAGSLTGGDIGTETPSEGAGVFKYTVPSGYLALCTANLPEPTISPNADTQADDYFNTVLWSGNGTSQSITGVGFQPDFTWIKNRSAGWSHAVTDSVRGVGKNVYTDATDAEVTNNAYGYLSSFDSDGFTVTNGASGAEIVNATSNTYVGWNWKAGGTAVSNTDGSITSSVSANTDAGFSIVSYTGNGTAGATVGHGLGVKPDFMIFKSRGAVGSWYVYHKDLTADNSIYLNLTNGSTDQLSSYNDTEPTSSIITFGDGSGTNPTSITMVGYIFAEIEGYSKFGSYTGNGSTDGTFVNTGFRPAFLLVKNADVANSWRLWDSARPGYNLTNLYLTPDTSGVEGTINIDVDLLSNGFKLRGSNSGINGSGNNIIYMAFAENPFKYANAR